MTPFPPALRQAAAALVSSGQVALSVGGATGAVVGAGTAGVVGTDGGREFPPVLPSWPYTSSLHDVNLLSSKVAA